MTLLEVVLAVTILASMSAVIASLWAQASRWTDDGASHHRAMRLARVAELLRSQWADRRTSAALTAAGASAAFDATSLTFVTATPILEPGWALVRARYVVERDVDTAAGAPSAWRLVYEEMPLVDLGLPAGVPGERLGAVERRAERLADSPPERRLVLLEACGDLKWERFGRSSAVERAEATPPGGDGSAETDNDPVDDSARADGADLVRAWREIEAHFVGRAPAVRLVGEFEERRFSCVFVLGDSR
jgi:hypothetical protein